MPLPLIIAAAGAAAAAAASLIGAAMAQGDYEKARKLRQDFADQYGDQMVPHLDKAVAQEVGPTQLASIQEDPQLRGTQMDTMKKLSDLYESGGMGPGDEAALQLANEGAQQQSSSDYASAAQGLAARGQSNNPALAAALASKTSGDVVNATATNRYRAQADARARAMSALEASGRLAGDVRSQDYNVASGRAGAQDRINQFNAGQRTDAAQQNNANQQAQFGDLMQERAAKGAAINGEANADEAQGDRTRQLAQGVANGLASVGAGTAGYYADPEKKKP